MSDPVHGTSFPVTSDRLAASPEARIAKEQEEAEAQVEEEKAAKIRAEELRPDREKLFALADEVNAIDIPELRAGDTVVVAAVLLSAANEIRGIAEDME